MIIIHHYIYWLRAAYSVGLLVVGSLLFLIRPDSRLFGPSDLELCLKFGKILLKFEIDKTNKENLFLFFICLLFCLQQIYD
jgi:hypothetical protein